MCLLIESIKIQNGQVQNIEAHNDRIARTRRALFGMKDEMNLLDYIEIPENLGNGIFKCRVVYAREIIEINFFPYTPKNVQTIRVVENDIIQYGFKFHDRACIDKLLIEANADDILIVQKGKITDTSRANIVLYDCDNNMVTPSEPLLCGTKREKLINNGIIKPKEILFVDIKKYSKLALINAMLDIGDVPSISIEKILPPLPTKNP